MRRRPVRPAVLAPLALVLALAAHPAAAQEAGVPVAAHDLPRGAVLGEADIGVDPAATSTAAAAARSLLGWETRRVVRAGEALRPPAVAPPRLVRSGEPVVVRLQGSTLALALRGTAAAAAGMGEKVWVRLGTGWRVEGTVAGPGEVTIESPGRAR